MTTPTDYPDRVRALLEAATSGEWHTDHFGQLLAGHFTRLLSVDDEDGFPRIRREVDGNLIVEVKNIAEAYLSAVDEVDRLARLLRKRNATIATLRARLAADRAAGGAA